MFVHLLNFNFGPFPTNIINFFKLIYFRYLIDLIRIAAFFLIYLAFPDSSSKFLVVPIFTYLFIYFYPPLSSIMYY